jgi:hypothetical protein
MTGGLKRYDYEIDDVPGKHLLSGRGAANG